MLLLGRWVVRALRVPDMVDPGAVHVGEGVFSATLAVEYCNNASKDHR